MAVESARTSDVGTVGVLSRAADALSADPRILLAGVAVVALGFVPYVSNVTTPVVGGLAVVLTHQALVDTPVTDRSYLRRTLSAIGATVIIAIIAVSVVLAGFMVVGVVALVGFVFPPLLVLAVLVGIVGVILPVLYVALRLHLALPAAFIDGETATDAVRQSWERAGGNVVTVLGVQIVTGLLSAVGALLIAYAFGIPFPGTVETGSVFGSSAESRELVSQSAMVLRYTAVGSSTVSATIPSPEFLLGYSVVGGLFTALNYSSQAVMYRVFEDERVETPVTT
ncbi:hypothetical protein [Haloarchaeobius salinus]|uniref:hypothetical protein n=1 Tax=Haloarchaeobius salinus TaxID=1198298 RepID=UPI00210CDA73|nr:hypothetical protein [Haloarchaeobius salinus]